MAPTIAVENLSKSFGKYSIIKKVSLHIERGTVYGLVGLNGAGKTTLLRLLLGILKPDEGTITVAGNTPWQHPSSLYRQCGVVLENDGFWGNLTAAENCSIYAAAKAVSSSELDNYLRTFWKENPLFTDRKKQVKHFSRGERMQCALCRAFMGMPSVFFLDEPAVALDINAYDQFKRLVFHARDRGATLIISSHQLDTIDELCDRVGILRDGIITEISRHRQDTATTWCIDTNYDESIKKIIEAEGGTSISYNKGWYFAIGDAATAIPEIVRQLAAAEYPVREVRRHEQGFGSAIRTLYAGSKTEETS